PFEFEGNEKACSAPLPHASGQYGALGFLSTNIGENGSCCAVICSAIFPGRCVAITRRPASRRCAAPFGVLIDVAERALTSPPISAGRRVSSRPSSRARAG